MFKRIGWSFVASLFLLGLAGCGGPPAEEAPEPVPQEEIDENADMGDVPADSP